MHNTESNFARVAVVGTSCSGKTTLAATLSGLLESPHVELDALHWGPNWTATPPNEFRARVERALSEPRWVCDGNYSSLGDLVWRRATAIVWLNYSFGRVMSRALRRTITRVVTREPLYADNRESFKQAFFSRDSILLWVASSYRRRKRTYRARFDSPEYSRLHCVELRSVRETRGFVNRLQLNKSRIGSV